MVASILRHTNPPAPVARNNAGGPTYVIDQWNRLNRFLILGSEGGTYYVNEKDHTLNNVAVVDQCLAEDPRRVVDTIVAISDAGRAPKNDYAIWALARAASTGTAQAYALSKLNEVCRTGTHLFQFVKAVDSMRGWGTALRRAVANWYLSKDPDQLAYQVLKYQQREGWSHRDVLRKVHPRTGVTQLNDLFRYITQGEVDSNLPPLVHAVEEIKRDPEDITLACALITELGVSREMLPTQLLTNPQLVARLAEKMPYTALMRNLGNLSKLGVAQEMVDPITRKLTDAAYLKKSRVHPISVLTALRTYEQGQGFRGKGEWPVIKPISDALETAFYDAFANVEPTGKKFLIGMDVSGSMSTRIYNGVLTSAEVAAALAMQLVRTEPWTRSFGFAHDFKPLYFDHYTRLNDALSMTRSMNFGSTDATIPVVYAMQQKLDVDVFVVITDSETWSGWSSRVTPAQALRKYRQMMQKPDAKLVVLATEATQFSIADPNDRNMLDIAGFDSSVPEVISMFARGEL